MPLPAPKGLTPAEIDAANRFGLATLGPPVLFAPAPPRPAHVGACACKDCLAPAKARKRQPPPQPWVSRSPRTTP
jgi:hypothetical protein